MRGRHRFGLRLAVLVCCALSLHSAFALRPFYNRTYVITRILDARTFDVARLGRIRLLGIAPAQHVRFADQAWQEAGEYCQANLAGRKVRLETDLQKSNIDGQRLVYLYLEDGTFFNLELIRAGYATVESNAVRQLRKFRAAEEEARLNRRGVWSEGQVFKSTGLSARSTPSKPESLVTAPAAASADPADREWETRSALEALQSEASATQTAALPTANPLHPTVEKPAVGSIARPVAEASVSPPVANPTVPSRSPQGIYPGARLFIEDMDKDLDGFIRAEIVKKNIPLVVVVDPEGADLIMTASESGAMIFGKADKVMLWAGEAGGRSLWWVGLKREGPRKVAEHLISSLKKEMEQPD